MKAKIVIFTENSTFRNNAKISKWHHCSKKQTIRFIQYSIIQQITIYIRVFTDYL